MMSYEDARVPLVCSSEDKMETVFEEFVKKLNPESQLNDYTYQYDKKDLDIKKTFNQSKEIFTGNKDSPLPNELSIQAIRNLRIIKCPKCNYNDCVINLLDYQISYYGCEHKHSFSSMYDDYFKHQTMDNSTIKCCEPGCDHTQKSDPLDFLWCLTCTRMLDNNKTYCKGCGAKHEKDHNMQKWNDKNYYCLNHFNRVDKYCFTCKQNLCKDCKKEHKNHKFKSYEVMTPSKNDLDDLEKNIAKIDKIIKDLDYVVNDLIYRLKGSVKMFKWYTRIAKDIIEKYKMFHSDFKNYEILKSIRNIRFSNDKIYKVLNSVIEKKDSIIQSGLLIDIYMKRKNRYYGDITTNPFNEDKDEVWIKEIEEKEKNSFQPQPNPSPKPKKVIKNNGK